MQVRNVVDLSGKIFGKLTIIKLDQHKIYSGISYPYWLAQCSCGNITSIRQTTLTGKTPTQSCGCLLNEFRKNILPGIVSKRNTIGFGEASFNHLYGNYKYLAKIKGYEFSLTKERFRKITECNCYYCGIQPLQIFKKPSYNGVLIYNGIDRLNNSIGYTDENVVTCCGICNKAKRNLPLETFKNWIKQITEYASKINFNY